MYTIAYWGPAPIQILGHPNPDGIVHSGEILRSRASLVEALNLAERAFSVGGGVDIFSPGGEENLVLVGYSADDDVVWEWREDDIPTHEEIATARAVAIPEGDGLSPPQPIEEFLSWAALAHGRGQRVIALLEGGILGEEATSLFTRVETAPSNTTDRSVVLGYFQEIQATRVVWYEK